MSTQEELLDVPKNNESEHMGGDEKDKSELEKKLNTIKASFDAEWSKKHKESSSKHGSEHGDSPSANLNGNKSLSNVRPKANRVETKSKLPTHTIHGFVNEILFLKNFLLKKKESDEFKTLAIVGKYGVGKTTLCKAVFNDVEVKQAYLPRLWVSMYSEQPQKDENPKIAVLKRILRLLGVEDTMFSHIKTEAIEEEKIKDELREQQKDTVQEKELSRLLYTLHMNLIGKKYLIVLDDIWEDNEWNQRLDDEKKKEEEKTHLSCGFPKGFGGRLILTTRDEKLAKEVVGEEEENLLRLFPRTDAETVWKIYRDAMITPMEPRYVKRFKEELMDKSCGIPLAARMLAKIELKTDETGDVKMDETGEDGVVRSDKPTKDSDVANSSNTPPSAVARSASGHSTSWEKNKE